MKMLLPTTLCMAAAAAVLNIWLSIRISQVRMREKIFVGIGDHGNEALVRHMRAQANFIENTPLTLILVAAVEIAGKGGAWLPPVAAVFVLGRVAHAFGMDGRFKAGRPIGFLTATLIQLGLAVVAALAAMRVM